MMEVQQRGRPGEVDDLESLAPVHLSSEMQILGQGPHG